jgi:hypothetical protein
MPDNRTPHQRSENMRAVHSRGVRERQSRSGRTSSLKTSDWIGLLGVVGTWLLAILAVWGEQLKSLLIHPTLTVKLADPRGELTVQSAGWEMQSYSPEVKYTQEQKESIEQYGSVRTGSSVFTERRIATRYYHIKLSNQQRYRFPPAHQAQIMITRLELLGPDQQPQGVWQQPLPLRWRYQETDPATTRTVGPAVEADLFYVTEKSSLHLTPMILPTNFPASYETAVRLWVTVQARSLETDSKPIRVQIAWDGHWEPGETEMAKHLVVSTAAPYPPVRLCVSQRVHLATLKNATKFKWLTCSSAWG